MFVDGRNLILHNIIRGREEDWFNDTLDARLKVECQKLILWEVFCLTSFVALAAIQDV